MPSPSDPTPAIAYGLYSQEPIRTPGGGLTMPPLPEDACTREASLKRLSYVAARAEIILVDWIDRLAVFGVSASFDMDRFERATMALWRLTAIRKSLNALEDNPNATIPPGFEPEVHSILASVSSAGILPASSPADDSSLGARMSSSATPDPSAIHDNHQEQAKPLGPRTASSADAPVSNTATPSSTTPTDSPDFFSTLRAPHSALESSALATPRLSALPALPSPSVRAVPACPTLSPEGITTFLSRTETDLAEATRPTPPILDLPPTPDKPLPSQASNHSFSAPHTPPLEAPPCHSSSSPRSALRTPPCTQCAEPFCASRIAVPFHHRPAVLKCDGTCRECSKTRSCKFTPAYLRPG